MLDESSRRESLLQMSNRGSFRNTFQVAGNPMACAVHDEEVKKV